MIKLVNHQTSNLILLNIENRHTNRIQNLLLFVIVCTPVFALREFLSSLGFNPVSYALYFNLLKDFFLILIFLLCCFALLKYKKYPASVTPFFIAFAAYTALVAVLSLHDPIMVAAGIRWSLPLLLIFLLQGHISNSFLQRLAVVTIILLIITTVVQLYQVTNRQFRWGTSTYGSLLGRVSGFYELPSTTGFVTCVFFFIIRYFFNRPAWVKKSLLAIAMLSNFLLSISTTGFILMLIMLVFPVLYRPGKYRPVFIAATLILSITVYLFLDKLNGRFPGDSSVSWNIRVSLMQNQLQHSQLVSSKFGNATNAVFVIKGALGKTVDTDITSGGGESFYPPLLGNYGSIFFFLFVGLLIYLLIKVVRQHSEAKSLFFFIAVLGAFTVRVTEIYPLSILIAILAAHYIYKKPELNEQQQAPVLQ